MQLAHSGNAGDYRENPGAFYVMAMVKALFTKEEQAQYQEAVMAFDQCFQLAKQNNMQEAIAAYPACSRFINTLSQPLLNWVMAFYGQRLCYYHYKRNSYEEGINLTKEISRTVNQLQQEGYHFLFFVEIQQRLNLSRIYFTQREIEKALSICAEAVADIYDKAPTFNSRELINGVPESELIEITQYEMIVEVLTEACNRTIAALKEEPEKLESSTRQFITPLLKLDFTSLSADPRYTCINRFISILGGLTGYAELQDSDVLFFMNSGYAHKKMLRVLNNYIELVDA